MRYFEHGIEIIKGRPASRKTAFLVAAALTYTTSITEHEQVVVAPDTNDLASDLTLRIHLKRTETKVDKYHCHSRSSHYP